MSSKGSKAVLINKSFQIFGLSQFQIYNFKLNGNYEFNKLFPNIFVNCFLLYFV